MSEELLDDELSTEKAKLVPASKMKRFINYMVDNFVILLFIFLFYDLLEGLGYSIEHEPGSMKNQFQIILFHLIYYFLTEGILDGKTLGKMYTKTRVVTTDGKPPEVFDIISRSFLRLIPFEPFSFLGPSLFGWHDRWSKTMVIEEEEI